MEYERVKIILEYDFTGTIPGKNGTPDGVIKGRMTDVSITVACPKGFFDDLEKAATTQGRDAAVARLFGWANNYVKDNGVAENLARMQLKDIKDVKVQNVLNLFGKPLVSHIERFPEDQREIIDDGGIGMSSP